jgi:radical SAM superfamily enzyme YgiQ (UPF0313 family)
MKVLMVSPRSPHAFWTFDQLLTMEKRRAIVPPLGLITVAALLPPNWEVRVVDRNISDIPATLWEWCDMVMLSSMLVQREDTLALISESKLRGKRTAVGGPYPTVIPEELVDAGADYIFRGEAEETIPLFIAGLASGEAMSVFVEEKKPDMTTSPIPRYDLLDMSAYGVMPFQTTRGCPFDCEFCDVIRLNGRKPRHKTPDQVIKELETLYALGWRGEVFVTDDNLIGRRAHAVSILEHIARWNKGLGEPFVFWTQVSVNLGEDMALIDRMTDANFAFVLIGVESADRQALVCSRKYHNADISLDAAIQAINRNGLSVIASFVIGLDGEEEGAGDRICEFVERNRIPIVMVGPLFASPHTALWERLKLENRLLPGESRPYHYGGALNYVPSRPESQIRGEYFGALDRLFEPRNFLRRSYDYFLNMRPTRQALGMQDRPHSLENRSSSGRSRFNEDILAGLSRFARLVWKQGIRPPYRYLFWKQLLSMRRKNPSRLVGYLRTCYLGENLFQLRNDLCRKAASR